MKKYLLILFLLLFLSSCSQDEVSPVVSPTLIIDNSSQYPPPNINSMVNAYPSPNNFEQRTNFVIQKPNESLSGITGKLNLNDQPIVLSNTTVYLTVGKGEEANIPPSILIGPSEDKGDYVSRTDNTGIFFITNINPGSYFLVASSTNSYSIIEDQTGNAINIQLDPNQLLDLGDVFVTLP
jgi:hypothetical protein